MQQNWGSNLKTTLEYKKGDVYLCVKVVGGLHYQDLVETEIIDVSPEARAVKINGYCGVSWQKLTEFHKIVVSYLGRYETTGIMFWKKRKLVKADVV